MIITLEIIIISIIIYVMINFIHKDSDKIDLAIRYGAFYLPRIEYKKRVLAFFNSKFCAYRYCSFVYELLWDILSGWYIF